MPDMKDLLKTILADQRLIAWKPGFIQRVIAPGITEGRQVVVISGIRRCGKSTLLQQIRDQQPERDYFINFDDERLISFSAEYFQMLHETLIDMFGVQKTWYFDEIQNVPGWERFVRRLHDTGHKVFLTGSNATMLSRELGTHLTGRFIQAELYPFSFREFLQFRFVLPDSGAWYGTEVRAQLAKQFDEYALVGGFPMFLQEGNDEILKSLYQSILYRDVMVRNKLTQERELLEMVYFLASNSSKPTTYAALCKLTGIKNPTTISRYLSYLKNTYLLFQVSKYDVSLRKQMHHPKKIYFIDNGLVRKIGFQFTEERGRLLENLVFVELKRRGHDIYYHSGKGECDFVLRQGIRITCAIQVCDHLADTNTYERELSGLLDAMKAYQLKEGLLLLRNCTEQTVHPAEGYTVRQVSVWQWLLENQPA